MWRTRAFIAVLTLLLPGIATAQPTDGAQAQETGCSIVYAETAPLTKAFPYYLTGTAERRVWDLLFEPLARRTGSGVNYMSKLLDFSRAVASEDQTAWTFPLAPSFWHSGRSFGPDDIIETFNALKKLDAEGREDWTQELGYLRSMEKITTDGKSITVHYTGTMLPNAARESLNNFYVIPWNDLPGLKDTFGGSLVDWVPQANIGKSLPANGRWMPPPGQSWTTREGGISLVSFPRFPDGESPISRIESKVQPVPGIQVTQFKDGIVNLLLSVPHSSLQQVEKWEGVLVLALQQNSFTSIIICNKRTPALRRKKVREALLYAIDRPAILDSEFGGEGEILESPYTSQSSYYTNKYAARKCDRDRARTLLREAGFEWSSRENTWRGPQGEQLDKLVFLAEESTDDSERSRIITRVKDEWQKLGISVEDVTLSAPDVQSRLEKGDYDFYMDKSLWSGNGSMRRVLSRNVTDHPENQHYFCSDEVERLLIEFESDEATRDRARRDAIGQQLHETIYEACDRIYLWSQRDYVAFRNKEIDFLNMGMTLFENPGLWDCHR